MELHCTLAVLNPEGASSLGGLQEIVVDFPDGATGRGLADALNASLGVRDVTVDGVPLAAIPAGSAHLRNGALLLAGGAPSGGLVVPAPSPLLLVVRSGPAAGTTAPLPRGTTAIGRRTAPGPTRRHPGEPGISLADPALSRCHASIEVSDAGVVLRDAGSTNGTWLAGARVRSAPLTVGQEFRIGASTCSLEFLADAPRLDPGAGGPLPPPARVVRTSPPSRKAALLTMALLPLVVGVGLALATGMWLFLALTAVSAVSLLIPLAEGRSAQRDFRRRLEAAADDDAAHRRRLAPDAGVLARAGAPAQLHEGPQPPDSLPASQSATATAIRLGTADQPAGVVIEPEDGRTPVPVLRDAPFVIELAGCIAIAAGPEELEGVVRHAILQMALLPGAHSVRVLVAGGSERLRLAARFLPRVRVLADSESCDAGPLEAAAGPPAGKRIVLVLLPARPAGGAADRGFAVRLAAERGWSVIGPAAALESAPFHAPATTVRIGADGGETIRGDTVARFAPDFLCPDAFESAARRHGRPPGAAETGGPPASCALDRVAGLAEADLVASWTRPLGPGSLPLPLGMSATGPLTLDLAADGPHVLIAGTTGSGKSELLRTLVAGAASLHPPDRLTFLLVDFKGGSGLGALAELPHCVGLVTDLAAGGVDRILASLRAELKSRERLLASTQSADISDHICRGGLLPRLAIVVDEFRVFIDEAPESLSELLRIAAVGRSLGMHLVLATQRPQGAVSADIRANVTTSIALRMQHAAESADVIGAAAAAHIPVDLPGRAFLTIGSRPPLEFQTASLGLCAVSRSPQPIRVLSAEQWLASGSAVPVEGTPIASSEAATSFVRAAGEAWSACGGGKVTGPVAPPLPQEAQLPPGVADDGAARLGIVDLPHEQRTAELLWRPEVHGHLALLGAASAGVEDAVKCLGAQLAAGGRTHVYALDGDGSLSFLDGHPRVGALVRLGELARAARVIERLGEASAVGRGPGAQPEHAPRLVVIVSAWGAWISAFRRSPQAWAEDALADLIRDGPGGGLFVVASGERELVASRSFSGVPARVYFPLGATDETQMSWPRLPAMPHLVGRAAAAGTLAPGGTRPLQCYTTADPAGAARACGTSGLAARPFRVDPLPLAVLAPTVAFRAGQRGRRRRVDGQPSNRRIALLVGIAGDEPEPFEVNIGPGDVLLALGPPGSGRTAFLTALPEMNPEQEFLRADDFSDPEAWESLLGRFRDRPGHPPVVLVDDADTCDASLGQYLVRLAEAGAPIVASAAHSPTLYSRCPVAMTARSTGIGLVLAPRSPSDGDVFGVRLVPPQPCPAGRAIAIAGGQATEVQLGFSAAVAGPVSGPAVPGRFAAWPPSPAVRTGGGSLPGTER